MDYPIVFSVQWFLRHQKRILWFCNTPLVRIWFRWILRIHGNKSNVGKRQITKILPNAIEWQEGGKIFTEFRSQNKFAKRLYYAFYPLWYLIHTWDSVVANNVRFDLNLGFDTLTAYPVAGLNTPLDSYIGQTYAGGAGESWATIQALTSGNEHDESATSLYVIIKSDTVTDKWVRLFRSFVLFDTSSIADTNQIDSATLSLWCIGKSDGLSITPDINIYSSTPAATNAIEAADYDNFGTTAFSTTITYAGLTTGQYNDFVLNSSGRTNISKTGISKFGVRNANYDVAGVAPTWSSGVQDTIDFASADTSGTTNDPKLVIVHSAASASPSASRSASRSASASSSASLSPSASESASESKSESKSESASPSLSGSPSASVSSSLSPSSSSSASQSPSASLSPSSSPSASGSASGSASESKSQSRSLSPSASLSPSPSVSASPSPASYVNNYSTVGNTYTDKYTSTL